MAGIGAGLFRYGESELEPAVQAEILLESARNEARVAVLELLLAIGFGVWLGGFGEPRFTPVAIFAVATVAPLLVDAQLRRAAARKLLAQKPRTNPSHVRPGGPSPGR